ncbi:hypothetical protein YC2023_066077 [Brassica napus]
MIIELPKEWLRYHLIEPRKRYSNGKGDMNSERRTGPLERRSRSVAGCDAPVQQERGVGKAEIQFRRFDHLVVDNNEVPIWLYGRFDGEYKIQYGEIGHLAMVPAKAPIWMHVGQPSIVSGQYGEKREPQLKSSERSDLHAGLAPCTDPWTAVYQVGCLFSTHRTSVAQTGSPWLSVCVRVCPSAHIGCPWVSISTHRTSMCVRQHTQDVRGCPCVCMCVRQHTQDVLGCPSVHISARCAHISTLVLGLRTLALPVDCLGDLGPRGLSVQYTHDVLGVCQHTQDVRGCLWLSVSTHRTSLAVRVCPSAHIGRPWVSVSTHRTSVCVRQHTLDVRGCLCVSVCVRQHTQDVHGCPSVHISSRWSLDSARWPFPWTVLVILAHVGCLFSTHRTSVGVRQHTHDVCAVRQHTQDICGCPCVYVGVRQHTQEVSGCPSAHTGRPCVSVSTHRTSVAVHQYTYQHAGPWTQHAGSSRGLFGMSVAVHSCPSAHTGHSWLSVCVRVLPCVSVSTHRTSVAVHQYTYQHAGPWYQHAGPSHGLFG